MLPNVITYQLPTLTASALATSQAATALAINLNVTSVLGVNQRRVVIGCAGDDHLAAFRIVGFNQANMTITELVAGGTATQVATSNLDYVRLISITPYNLTTPGALYTTAGSVTVGGSGLGACLWQVMNWHATPTNISVSGVVVSTSTGVNYSVQYTYDDPNNPPTGTTTIQPFTHPVVNSATTTMDGVINDPVTAVRLQVNSGSGTVRGTFIQAGIGSP